MIARGLSHAWIRRRRWLPIACAILVVGLGLSLGGALLWRSSVRSRERQQFQTNATDASETAETLLRRDADLVTTLRGVLTMQPNMSATRFDEWVRRDTGQAAPDRWARDDGRGSRAGARTGRIPGATRRRSRVSQVRRRYDRARRTQREGRLLPAFGGRDRDVVHRKWGNWCRATGAIQPPRSAASKMAASCRRACCGRSPTAASSWSTHGGPLALGAVSI
jgi:hypothetical protein